LLHRARQEDRREGRDELAPVAQAVVAPREAGIRRELGPLDRGAERLPETLHPPGDVDPAVGGRERLEGHEVGMGAPLAAPPIACTSMSSPGFSRQGPSGPNAESEQ